MYRDHELESWGRPRPSESVSSCVSRRSFLAAGTAVAAVAAAPAALAQSAAGTGEHPTRFMRIPTQFIAALGDSGATSGSHAERWGLWRLDPGPRGVSIAQYERLMAAGGVAPAGWQFDRTDWWLEEHGLIMEAPEFPLPPRKYMVTGNRDARSVLTVHPMGKDGTQHWVLADGATIYDVTHLRCRSARYTPAASARSCSPAEAPMNAFPVSPGAPMPPVESCSKQDYAVLIVLGVAVENG